MQKTTSVFFALLLCLSCVCSMRLNPIDASMLPSNSIRAQLANILIEVQQDQTPKTIQKFLENIRDMMTKLQAEQKKHQEISDQMMKQCTEEEEFRKKEVADATDALNRANGARTKCDNSLKAAEKDLPELESAHKTYVDELDRATKNREQEHEHYLQRKKDYEEAIAFLTDFIEYVKANLKDFKAFSFVEKSQVLLRHATKLGLLQTAVPVLVALASSQAAPTSEIPAHNNYEYVKNEDVAQKLKDSLDTLLNRIQADWKDNEETEIKAVQAFEALKAQLTAAINTLAANIEKTKQQITDMNKCITDEDAVIATASKKLERNATLKDSASKMCNQFAAEFIHATQSRTEEIQTINEILAIIEKRFGTLPKDIVDYLHTVENGWVAYQNSTEFKKFVDYQQAHQEVNAAGADLVSDKNLIQ